MSEHRRGRNQCSCSRDVRGGSFRSTTHCFCRISASKKMQLLATLCSKVSRLQTTSCRLSGTHNLQSQTKRQRVIEAEPRGTG